MYKVEQKDYGIKLTFEGFIAPEEMSAYKKEFKTVLDRLPPQFGLMADMRYMKPLCSECQEIFSANPEWTANRIVRSATIFTSALTKMQVRRLATEWKMNDSKRYFDAAKHSNWEQLAENWLKTGQESGD